MTLPAIPFANKPLANPLLDQFAILHVQPDQGHYTGAIITGDIHPFKYLVREPMGSDSQTFGIGALDRDQLTKEPQPFMEELELPKNHVPPVHHGVMSLCLLDIHI